MPKAEVVKVEWYEIHHKSFETECKCCGVPLYVGDVAYNLADDETEHFCGSYCVRQSTGAQSVKVIH